MSPNVPATRELPAIEAALEPHVERIQAAAVAAYLAARSEAGRSLSSLHMARQAIRAAHIAAGEAAPGRPPTTPGVSWPRAGPSPGSTGSVRVPRPSGRRTAPSETSEWVVDGTRHRWLASVRIAPIACTCIGSPCHITPRTKPGCSTGTTPSSGSRPKTSSGA